MWMSRSPHVDWSSGAVELLTEPVAWPDDAERPRRAGVSSFGISGTNAHVVIEEAPADDPSRRCRVGADAGGPGRCRAARAVRQERGGAARRRRRGCSPTSTRGPALHWPDLAVSLAATRAALEHRAVVTGADRDELLRRSGVAGRGPACAGRGGRARSAPRGKTAFLFSGQGAQRVGMGRGLYEAFPVFAEALDEVCGWLDGLLGRSLRDVVWGDGMVLSAGVLDGTGCDAAGVVRGGGGVVPVGGVVGVCGPDFVAGHSIGEVAAAYVAGVLSLEDACVLVAARGRLMQALPAGGAMVAVGASEEEVVGALSGFVGRVGVAAVNGPVSVVVSGDVDAVVELEGLWRGRGRKTRRLAVSHAFHSPRDGADAGGVRCGGAGVGVPCAAYCGGVECDGSGAGRGGDW